MFVRVLRHKKKSTTTWLSFDLLPWLFLCLCIVVSWGVSQPAYAGPLSLNENTSTIDLLPVGSRLFVAQQAPTQPPESAGDLIATLTPASQIDRLGGRYWLYSQVKNDTDVSQWVFNPHNSIIDRIDFFVYRPSQRTALQTGHLYPHDFSLHYGKQFELKPGEQAEVLIYFDSRYYSSLPSFALTPARDFKGQVLTDNFWIMGCIGAILVLSIYNLFLGVWTRDRNYIYYALYLVFSIIGWSATFNVWAQWFELNSLALILVPFYPAIAFNILYYIHFLELPKSSKLLSNISYGLVAVCVLLAPTYLWVSPGDYFIVLSMVTALWLILGLTVGIYRLRQGYKPALFFVAAFSVVVVAVTLSILPNLGYQEIIANADLGTLVAQTLDMLLLALALAHRIRILRDERELALQAAVDSEQRASDKEKKANRILKEANIKLRTALNVAEEESTKKNEFLRLVSHELRTPLHSIASSVEEWDDQYSSAEKNQLIEYITYGAARLRTQVDNLVLIAETESGDLVAGNYIFELQPILERLAANTATLLAPKPVDYVVKFENLPFGFAGDGYLLEHLLRTNIENACKYTDKGHIELHLEWLTSQQSLQVRITDTGIGMDQPQLAKVFDEFAQTSTGLDRQSEGFGLGLTVSKRMCAALSAQYHMESTHGVGTIVSINIPLKAVSDEITAQTLSPGNGAVLVVEDNPVNAKVLGRIVVKCGFEVEIVHSGEAAIEAVSEKIYGAILMDIQMPGMDGITATAQIRKRGVTTPIIAVTANSDTLVREQCMQRGMNGFLVKPVRTADIKRALQRQLPFVI